MIGFSFHETMEGTVERDGVAVPFRLDFRVKGPTLLRFLTRWHGIARGRVRLNGIPSAAQGTLDVSPKVERSIRYAFTFADADGRPLRFEGAKRNRFFFGGWRVLHGVVYDADGAEWGKAVLRFSFLKHLVGLLVSIRVVFRRPEAVHG